MTGSPSSTSRPQVLQLAYACSPERGSEYAVGWNRALESARYFDTWVITGEYDESHLEVARYLESHGPIRGLTFVSVPEPKLQRWLTRIPGCPYQIGYQVWHRAAFHVAKRLHQELGFDLVHQVNYCGYREPGYLWKLDVPFVWGPVGGTQNYPWRFLAMAGIRGVAWEGMRTLMNHVQLRLSPRVRRAVRRSSAFLTANSTNFRDFERVHGVRSIQLVETGINPDQIAPRQNDPVSRPMRLLWSGELSAGKAIPLLIRALAQLPESVRYELRVIGDGPDRISYQRLSRRRGVDQHIEWTGRLPHREALAQFQWSDVFVFTSLRDTTGTVVLEALCAGLPVVCLDHQGVRDIVTPDCGIKIPVTTPKQAATAFAAAIEKLAQHADEHQRLSGGAVERSKLYSWSVQGMRMAEVYRNVMALKPVVESLPSVFQPESFPSVDNSGMQELERVSVT